MLGWPLTCTEAGRGGEPKTNSWVLIRRDPLPPKTLQGRPPKSSHFWSHLILPAQSGRGEKKVIIRIRSVKRREGMEGKGKKDPFFPLSFFFSRTKGEDRKRRKDFSFSLSLPPPLRRRRRYFVWGPFTKEATTMKSHFFSFILLLLSKFGAARAKRLDHNGAPQKSGVPLGLHGAPKIRAPGALPGSLNL